VIDRNEEFREVDELLPWYVNGTLSDDERERVRRYLGGNEQGSSDVEMLQGVREAVKVRQFDSPGELGRHRLKAAIEKESRGRRSGGPSSGWWRPAMAAAVLVIAVQSVLLISSWQSDDAFKPAGVAPERPAIQLRFQPGATEGEIRGLLSRLDVEIVSGPGSVGVYRVAPVGSDANIEELVARLRAAPGIVSFAEVE